MRLYIRAICQLLRFHYFVIRRDFALLRKKVRDCPCYTWKHSPGFVERVCRAMDIVCFCYPRRTLCLQRSAATVCLLRQCGVQAELVIGAQQTPFRAHAWVEVDGLVVNDKSYVREMYAVLDRC
jgi:prolyl oligopeptidase